MSFAKAVKTPSVLRQLATARPAYTTRIQQRLAHQDYGSGSGDPKAEKPQEQGTSDKTRNIEHPGPSAPDTSKHGGGESQTGEVSKDGGKASDKANKGTQQQGGARPALHTQEEPDPGSNPEEVKRHNREIDNRVEKQSEHP
ncbi:hypothetical protein K431DRAFT_281456 [Polychaeton citri CBS 116435]|uniref:Uncharacterized protein n=1 Tax=Polychaeton citri CBS 116435 TaxID=1314669 RepID=A0A9P4UTQ4_9PEZI|nr:hypothetical protein K431DRAFT_281456 [Polychaeton citri CBS 116435]